MRRPMTIRATCSKGARRVRSRRRPPSQEETLTTGAAQVAEPLELLGAANAVAHGRPRGVPAMPSDNTRRTTKKASQRDVRRRARQPTAGSRAATHGRLMTKGPNAPSPS
jgi:hypothetical protein